MPGSFDLDTGYSPLSADALSVGVYLYAPGQGYALLPNVVPLGIYRREGSIASAASFRYLMDDNLALNFGWPSRFEQLFGLYIPANPYAVYPDQRLVVLAQLPDGSPWVLWDGFAQVPQVDVEGGNGHATGEERVIFTGAGVEVRCWDAPISGSVRRAADSNGFYVTDGSADVQTDLRMQFNPAAPGVPGMFDRNCTAFDTQAAAGVSYPVIVDARSAAARKPGPKHWHVGPAVRSILGLYNKAQTYVQNPTFAGLDQLLEAYGLAAGAGVLDPGDPSTYTVGPVRVMDYDASNKPWPEAVGDLVSFAGFLTRYDTETAGDGTPATYLRFYRRDEFATAQPKAVYLDVEGATVDPAFNNAKGIHLAMDSAAIVNAYQVETDQRRVEVSWILYPLYRPAAGDELAANRPKWWSVNIVGQPETTQAKYRWYGADECGDGHWADAGAWNTDVADFSDVFPPDSDGTPSYSVRFRQPSNTLISKTLLGTPLRADLSISFDYEGDSGAPWDGTGTWQSIPGGWRLLPDRLGIEVTAGDPEMWAVGAGGPVGGAPNDDLVPGGVIRGVTWWANPPAGAPTNTVPPALRLTTVIEDDLRMPISVGKRVASPTVYARYRVADRRDVYQYTTIDASSMYYLDQGGEPDSLKPLVVRDDTKDATRLARELQAVHEFPALSGTITIPYITGAYEVGDRIALIYGRGCSLQTNIGAGAGNAPTYPWVVGVSWNFDGGQSTTLALSDTNAIPSHGRRVDRRAAVHHA